MYIFSSVTCCLIFITQKYFKNIICILFVTNNFLSDTIEENYYSLLQFDLKPRLLTSNPVSWGYKQVPHLGMITILGVEFHVTQVFVNGISKKFEYDDVFKVRMFTDFFMFP